ncbi:Holliday junction branch migration protein RuvA [Parvularcula sp. LCG005]|uniref:Holliday junction branch migration protein RuvA n=1 Tax=Parvularcula sp. LCG005 TaxID=3078805 RepID=UPI00294300AB|nr:Holliday junction branch migration protein RuvA [Parvularcula sp. LCG005]WOI52810.1 Holliday junction branch migration protein RuvA [Parvularcula sp. LCG005]
MIGHLNGRVLSVYADTAIIDVGGVGYEVSGTSRLLGNMAPGDEVSLSIETLVAETFIRLVAFPTETERRTFRLLQSVQGVGAKAALSILHVLSPHALMDAIAVQDKTAVARAQGVGPKLAQRIVTELKGKTGVLLHADDFRPGTAEPPAASPPAPTSMAEDAVSALINLGYDETLARRTVRTVAAENDSVEAIITAALKSLSTS